MLNFDEYVRFVFGRYFYTQKQIRFPILFKIVGWNFEIKRLIHL